MPHAIPCGDPRSSRARHTWYSLLLLSALVAAACRHDAPTGLSAGPVRAGRVIEIPVAPASADDPAINYSDTYLIQTQVIAETSTVKAAVPFDDPNTGLPTTATTVTTEPQTVNVTAGYGYDGQPRITNGFQQSSGEETIWLRRVTDVTEDRRADGSDTQPFLYDPMDEVGSLVGAVLDPTAATAPPPPTSPPPGGCLLIEGCAPLLMRQGGDDPGAIIRPLGARGPVLRGIGGAQRTRILAATDKLIRIEESLPAAARGSSASAHMGSLSSASASEERVEHRITRDYEPQDAGGDQEWQLKHTMYETFTESAERNSRFAFHVTVVKSKFHRNREKDEERRNKSRRQAPHPTSAPVVGRDGAVASATCDPTTAIIPCDPTALPGEPLELPVDKTTVEGGDYTLWVGGSGPPLVMQHGIWSDARTWGRTAGWLARDVQVRSIHRFSLAWANTYEDQAAELHRKIAGAIGGDRAVIIGHSNGGMIGRYLARRPSADPWTPPANVEGVITVGTPHWGVPLARYAMSMNRLFGWGKLGTLLSCAIPTLGGCNSYLMIASSPLRNIFGAYLDGPPVIRQMQPNSVYHDTFNREAEGFRRFGVTSEVWARWMPWRGYGEAFCFPESGCGGSSQVRRIDRIYKRDISCGIIATAFQRWLKAARCFSDATFLRAVDKFFQRYVDTSGDGVVPAWSQRYPNIPDWDRYTVYSGPFHWGETESGRVGNRIETILVQRMGVPGLVRLGP